MSNTNFNSVAQLVKLNIEKSNIINAKILIG